jgi:signal transduction histidine kinase
MRWSSPRATGTVTPAQTEALDHVSRSQQHLLRLINDILNLACIQAGRVAYHLQSISLNDIVQSVLPVIESRMAAKSLRYGVDVPLELNVGDTGVGIPAGRLDEVFEPFIQLESSLSARIEGTGLGLSISRDMARGMGGDLTAESTLGVGSTFTIRLQSE